MARYFHRCLPVFFVFVVLLPVTPFRSLLAQEDSDNIYAQVSYKGDTFILSLTAGSAEPNLLVSSETLPKHIRPETMFVSSNGQTLFAIGVPSDIQPFPLYYTRIGESFPETTFYAYSARASVSADGNYLYYISVDSMGLLETYNFFE